MKLYPIIILTVLSLNQVFAAPQATSEPTPQPPVKRVACMLIHSFINNPQSDRVVDTKFKKIEIPISSCNVTWSATCRSGRLIFNLNKGYKMDLYVQTEDKDRLADRPSMSLSFLLLHETQNGAKAIEERNTTVIGDVFAADINFSDRETSDIVQTTMKFRNPEVPNLKLQHYGDYSKVSDAQAAKDGVIPKNTLWEMSLACFYDRTKDVVELLVPEDKQ
ncbi:MAG: hypothetical protein RJB66_233 [Pseudomonadota bacterium]|jgi:hypothetical protein